MPDVRLIVVDNSNNLKNDIKTVTIPYDGIIKKKSTKTQFIVLGAEVKTKKKSLLL